MTDYDQSIPIVVTHRPTRLRRRWKWRLAEMRTPTPRKRRLCARDGHPRSRIYVIGYTYDPNGHRTELQCERCGAHLTLS